MSLSSCTYKVDLSSFDCVQAWSALFASKAREIAAAKQAAKQVMTDARRERKEAVKGLVKVVKSQEIVGQHAQVDSRISTVERNNAEGDDLDDGLVEEQQEDEEEKVQEDKENFQPEEEAGVVEETEAEDADSAVGDASEAHGKQKKRRVTAPKASKASLCTPATGSKRKRGDGDGSAAIVKRP